MPSRTLVLAAVTAWTTPAAAGGQPIIRIDATTLVDETVTVSGRPLPVQAITAPVSSPPVSLSEATRGLVSGGEGDDARHVAAELERAYRAVMPTGVSTPTSRR